MVTGLAIRDAVVRYGPTVAVDHVSLDVAPGEVVALLGASGSGKSSLLRAVAGLEPLAAGTVSWDGVDLTAVPVHRRGFAMMFQDGQLFPHLSVAGNVGYALAGRERAQRDRRVGELLELVGLEGYGPRPVTALSGGQAQRVALARSLAASPRLLMLDEPLSALDTGLREHLLGVLDTTLQATGTPALYVTHDQDEAFAIADRVAVLSGGRLLQVDDPATLWRQPVDAEVADFLGYRLTLEPRQAADLGWPGTPSGLVAVGPDGLMADPAGTEVPVLGVRPRRGGTEFSVSIPGAGVGRVRTRELSTHADRRARLAVRLDPAGCVVLPTGSALDASRIMPMTPESSDERANPVAG
ncbi:MAG TPA: ABC transporter ATP-binding protein [Propionicimonas sp.]|uniref:ABC transporter ATP-binding protein n=1 Tax=Propionicimonas sp. TaxID=1955623 RepID=UPI002F3F6B08